MKPFVLLLTAALLCSAAQAQAPHENLTAAQIMARSLTELAPGL